MLSQLQSQVDALTNNPSAAAAAGQGGVPDVTIPTEESMEDKPAESYEGIADKIVVQEYKYEGHSPYYVLVLQNTSDQDCDVDVGLTLYNADGKTIGAKTETVYSFQQRTEVALTFSLDEMPESAKVTLNPSKNTYICVDANLSYETSVTDDKVIASVTNNGKDKANFVKCHALFFNGDKLVYTDERFFVDKNSTINPGATISEELQSREAFDTVKIYLNGRGENIN